MLRLLLAVCSGLSVTACGVFLCAAGLLLGNVPAWLLAWISTVLWCAGAFRAADCFARHTRHHGIGCGLLCGGMFCIILLIGMQYAEGVLLSRVLLRCVLLLLTGMCGGVYGVNRKITKPPN